MGIQAFISCKFPPDETVKRFCSMLAPEVSPYVSTDIKIGSLPDRLKEKIRNADCLIAILTAEGGSAFVQNEVGVAFALNKPIFAIYEETVSVEGIQPYLSTFIKYRRGQEIEVAGDVSSLKQEIIAVLGTRDIVGAPQELLEQLRTNGIIGVYPDRATAFRAFMPIWERERDIKIAGSTVEGFKRGIGIDARDLLLSKLRRVPDATFQILLTHGSFARFREGQEQEQSGYILQQVKATERMLRQLQLEAKSRSALEWKFFKGQPTCFMIMAGAVMLINPYLYMQPSHFNFSMIVRDTSSMFDIYNHYRVNHFE